MTDAQQMVERAADNSVDRAGHRTQWIVIGFLIVSVAAVAVAFFSSRSSAQERDATQDRDLVAVSKRADEYGAVARQLADQVRALGAQPEVQPPPAGTDGNDGRDGAPGRDGAAGRDGVSPACLAEPAQCRGSDGADGVDGQDGVDGADGAAGTDGAPGQDGRSGVDGQPPAGWTWTDSEGRTQSCSRDPGSADIAPTYTCTAPSPAPPTTEPGVIPTVLRRR